MTAERARGALAVLQDTDGRFLCEVPCGYIVEQTASAHKPRRNTASSRATGGAITSRQNGKVRIASAGRLKARTQIERSGTHEGQQKRLAVSEGT